MSDKSKEAFVRYLKDGGGLIVVHFANGAFHFSLPKAEESDWPEYRKIVRRVWNHKGKSGHDRFGKGVQQLGAAAHDAVPFLADTRQIPGHVDHDEQGHAEGVAHPHETRCLLR